MRGLLTKPCFIAVSVDVNGSPRPTFATAFDSAATAVPVTAPRRQRPSRPGARRPVTTPRSPPHSHHRNQIDRALVQDFLASQNIRPSDQITGQPYSMIEELLYRNLQALQTTMSQGRIARRSMVTTLPSVPLDELPPDERGEHDRSHCVFSIKITDGENYSVYYLLRGLWGQVSRGDDRRSSAIT